jgi:hypothetical protein
VVDRSGGTSLFPTLQETRPRIISFACLRIKNFDIEFPLVWSPPPEPMRMGLTRRTHIDLGNSFPQQVHITGTREETPRFIKLFQKTFRKRSKIQNHNTYSIFSQSVSLRMGCRRFGGHNRFSPLDISYTTRSIFC